MLMNDSGKLFCYAMLSFLLLSGSCARAAISPVLTANPGQNTGSYDYLGDMTHPAQIPCGFGPFKAKSTAIGVYRGRVQIFKDDLKGQPLFLVIRIRQDKVHDFG